MPEWVRQGVLARSGRPGGGLSALEQDVDAWLAEVRGMGIRSIVCLLDDQQLRHYAALPGGLLEHYRRAGFHVGHVPVPDRQTPPIAPEDLEAIDRLFRRLPKPVLVHCWAGIDRTGAAVDYLLSKTGT